MLLVVKIKFTKKINIFRLDNRLKHLRKYDWYQKKESDFNTISCTKFSRKSENYNFEPKVGHNLIQSIFNDKSMSGHSIIEIINGNKQDLRRVNLKWIS